MCGRTEEEMLNGKLKEETLSYKRTSSTTRYSEQHMFEGLTNLSQRTLEEW